MSMTNTASSGGSRISRRGGMDPLGERGPPTWVLFRKMYAKVKELGPVGGMRWSRPLDPPMARNE